MWNKIFWKAASERMVRAAAAAVFGAYFAGDVVFDVMSLNSWGDAGAVGAGAAIGSLLLSLIGNGATGSGPAFTKNETTVNNR